MLILYTKKHVIIDHDILYLPKRDTNMFEKISEFFKKQFKNALHAVTKSLHTFLPLLLAVLFIETLLFTVFLAYENNMRLETEAVEETYDYHLTISGLSNIEKTTLKKYAARSENAEGHYMIKEVKNGVLYIKLLVDNKRGISPFEPDTLKSNYEDMIKEVPIENLESRISLSPLYLLEDEIASLAFSRFLTLLAISLLLIVLLVSFYSIHLNNEKFTYGIYAAFGGKASRLVLSAGCELSICALFTLLPSYFISALLCYALYSSRGVSYDFSFFALWDWIIIFLITLPILFITAAISINRVSLSEPMRLIEAQDNTNLVVSPSSSFNLIKKRFPLGYELFSAWRFRKHYFSMIFTTALLSMAFVLGYFSSATYAQDMNIRHRTGYDFSVQFFNTDVLPDSYPQYFSSLAGISAAHKGLSETDASPLAHLLFVKGNNVSSGAGLAVDEKNSSFYTGNINYIATTGNDDIAYLKETYTISGSPDRLYEDSHNILIGSSYRNKTTFRFEVGDTITIGKIALDDEGGFIRKPDAPPPSDNISGRELWMQQLATYEYALTTFTVVGIIEDYPSAQEGVPIVFTKDVYEEFAEQSIKANTLYITADKSATLKHLVELEESLNATAERLNPDNFLVRTSDTVFDNKMEQLFCLDGMLAILSVSILAFIPLHWFYAQALFFRRRRDEFYALHSISASLGRIRSIFTADFALMLPIGALAAAFSFGLSRFMTWIFSYILPNFFQSGSAVVETLTLPSWLYPSCLILTFLSCLFSALFPYLSYRRQYLKSFKAEELE